MTVSSLTGQALEAGCAILVSVVICNYNYEGFLAEAIDSALALDWPKVEVIVVDDGSTDGSHSIMARYGDRIIAVFQRNGGSTSAYNAGFARARGEMIIFLDSDDRLDRTLLRELAIVWRRGISKVQVQMRVIDAAGRPTGLCLPQYYVIPTPQLVRAWAATSGAYPTPPGSGNAYSREFLEKIFPLDVQERSGDSDCLAAAPFLGDVVTVAKPLVDYRVHGRNQGAMSDLDVQRFGREVSRARRRIRYAQRLAETVKVRVRDDAFDKSLSVLPYRLASLRLDRERHPIAGDTTLRVIRDAVRAAFAPQGLSRRARLTLVAWTGLVALLPRPAAERLVLWRFAPQTRPRFVRGALRRLRVVGAAMEERQP